MKIVNSILRHWFDLYMTSEKSSALLDGWADEVLIIIYSRQKALKHSNVSRSNGQLNEAFVGCGIAFASHLHDLSCMYYVSYYVCIQIQISLTLWWDLLIPIFPENSVQC